ncbi:MAG: TGS domain-containing protein [bacterium]|nr:TGS domain-containing protein [bacterium]
MPANLPPQYFEAEKEYRNAKTIEEKIQALRKMLSIMPKHKGTDKLQAEIRAKISKLQEELENQKKGKRTGPHWYIKKEGAGQVILLGLPNSGKTTLVNALCNTNFVTANYPFTTQQPQAAMMDFEDIKIQLIDTPPLKEENDYRIFELIRNADLLTIVLGLESNPILDFTFIQEKLSEKNITLKGTGTGEYELFGPVTKRAIVILNKLDLTKDTKYLEDLESHFKDTYGIITFPLSALYGTGTEEVKKEIFKELDIIRVYTKEPGKQPVLEDPLILKRGSTVLDAAREIHKDFEKKLKYAKVWGSTKFEGQRVERDYRLEDKDIVEFHV